MKNNEILISVRFESGDKGRTMSFLVIKDISLRVLIQGLYYGLKKLRSDCHDLSELSDADCFRLFDEYIRSHDTLLVFYTIMGRFDQIRITDSVADPLDNDKIKKVSDLSLSSLGIVTSSQILITDKETGKHSPRIFEENGMELYDVEVLSLSIDPEVNEMLEQHQMEMISKTLELSDADARMKVVKALDELEKQEIKLKADTAMYKQTLENQKKAEEFKQREEMNAKIRAAELAEQKAKSDMQAVLNAINEAQLARDKAASDAQIEVMKQKSEIKKAEQEAYAKTVVDMFKAIQPDLVAAIQG